MRRFSVLTQLAAFLLLGLLPGIASANIVSLVGDKDAFGIPGASPPVPPDGTRWRDDLGGTFFSDYRSAADIANAPFTDQWFAGADISYNHTYVLAGPTPTSAVLDIQTAGIADGRGPWDVLFNGVLVGTFAVNNGPDNFQVTKINLFNIPVGLLTGNDTVLLKINDPTVNDGYSINYSELRITQDQTAVPEPATLTLAGMGVAALAGFRLHRRK